MTYNVIFKPDQGYFYISYGQEKNKIDKYIDKQALTYWK